jgi:hypothetical protein
MANVPMNTNTKRDIWKKILLRKQSTTANPHPHNNYFAGNTLREIKVKVLRIFNGT